MAEHYDDARFWLLASEAIERSRKLIVGGGKAEDYRSGGVTMKDYADSGIRPRSLVFFNDIWKKTLRLKSLLSSGREPSNESIEDNLVDIISYCAFCYAQHNLDKPDKPALPERLRKTPPMAVPEGAEKAFGGQWPPREEGDKKR